MTLTSISHHKHQNIIIFCSIEIKPKLMSSLAPNSTQNPIENFKTPIRTLKCLSLLFQVYFQPLTLINNSTNNLSPKAFHWFFSNNQHKKTKPPHCNATKESLRNFKRNSSLLFVFVSLM